MVSASRQDHLKYWREVMAALDARYRFPRHDQLTQTPDVLPFEPSCFLLYQSTRVSYALAVRRVLFTSVRSVCLFYPSSVFSTALNTIMNASPDQMFGKNNLYLILRWSLYSLLHKTTYTAHIVINHCKISVLLVVIFECNASADNSCLKRFGLSVLVLSASDNKEGYLGDNFYLICQLYFDSVSLVSPMSSGSF